jgi:hypothetical protein
MTETGTATENASPQLVLPGWVPDRVAAKGIELFRRETASGNSNTSAILQRLLTDPRMRQVWAELSKRRRRNHRSTDTLLYPARPPNSVTLSPMADDVQAIALLELFMHAFLALRLLGEPEICNAGLATQLKEIAIFLSQDKSQDKRKAPAVKALRKAASAYDTPKRESDQARALAQYLAEFLQERFGNAMHGITSIIVSVLLNRAVSASQVREWCARQTRRRAPGGKSPKPR